MKPNRDDIQFARRSTSPLERTKEIGQLARARFTFYTIAGSGLAQLAYEFFHPIISGDVLKLPNPFIGVFTVLCISLALHADAKIKVILVIQENQKNEN